MRAVCIVSLFFVAGCKYINVERRNLARIPVLKEEYTIEVDYVAADDPANDLLQIRKKYENGKIAIVKNYKWYDAAVRAARVNDSTLRLVRFNAADHGAHPG